MQLVKPSTKYQESYLAAFEEGKPETNHTSLTSPRENQSFAEFVREEIDHEKGKSLPKDWVSETVLWLIDTNEFIGRVSIRHRLTETLRATGGHIGYWIRPSKRKLGYGKIILKLALSTAKKLKIHHVLVTCDETNIGSRKIIEANDGVLENSIMSENEGSLKRRYWITLK